MNERIMTCSLCGYRFNPKERVACPSCPLNKGCQLVCCPNCGFETIDVDGSSLARLAGSVFSKQHKNETTITQHTDKPNREI